MVYFIVPPLTDEMIAVVPRQRHTLQQFMLDKKIYSYSLSVDRSKLWAVVNADSEDDLIDIIEGLPMTKFLKYHYSELMFHNAAQILPSLSLN
jgi:hypothetical protein